MASAAEIQGFAQRVRREAPGLTTGHTLSPRLRGDLETLAITCGLVPSLAYRANDNDLISVYLVALKNGASAMRTAQKVAMRLDDTLLGGTPEPEPAPQAPTAPPQAPTAPLGTPLEVIRDLIKAEVTGGALRPIEHALEVLDRQTDTRFDAVSEKLDTLRSSLLADVADIALGAATEALKQLTPTRLEIVRQGEPTPHALGIVHKDTAKIINALQCGVNVYLHGPAGSGKTTVGHKVAEAFGLQFYFAAKVESEYQLIGFTDARGETVRTAFRNAFERGGVFLFDEMDASSQSAVVAMNAALANGWCAFPDGIVTRHKDFYAIGAGNTKLTGANRQYVGRNQQDAASIDRWAFIEFGYDDELERALATDQRWCAYVQAVRAAIAERGLSHLVTPRATYDGCKLLAGGFDRETVKSMVVYKGLDADTVRQIETAVRER